jgi:hypothetical protein
MSEESNEIIEIDKMSVDQFAGAVVLILGAIGSLLLVIWQSKCHCKVNLCYLFQCERRPPNEDEMKGLKEQTKKMNKKEDKILKKEDQILNEVEEQKTPRLLPTQSKSQLNLQIEEEDKKDNVKVEMKELV